MIRSFYLPIILFAILSSDSRAQGDKTTVSFALDHNRIIVPVKVGVAGGRYVAVNAWFDNGNPILAVTDSMAKEIGLMADSLEGRIGNPTGAQIRVGSMSLPIEGLPVEVTRSSTVASGLQAQVTLPARLLKQFDVVIDYPSRKLTIGRPGAIRFEGTAIKAFIHPENGLIQIPSSLGTDTFPIALDLGTPISLVSTELLSGWTEAHPAWSSVRGAIGVANLWGMDSEAQWRLLRVHHLLFGGVDLPALVAATCPPEWLDYFRKRVGIPTAGLIGAEALLQFSIGIDYAHKKVYMHQNIVSTPSRFDLIGLTLRPVANGRYIVLGIADYKGKPSIDGVLKGDTLLSVNRHPVTGDTMGQVWSELSGPPGAIYTLELKRAGKTIRLKATVRHFLD